MRYIEKPADAPSSIREWLEVQRPVGLNLDYPNFNDKPRLRAELIALQFGLCAYTGTPIDERLVGIRDDNLAFQAHIEHVKAQSICRAELEAQGKRPGRDLGEDVDHRNLVAALEVKRKPPTRSEMFGATARGNEEIPVKPTEPGCEERFEFDARGGVRGLDRAANDTVRLLRLDHPTLTGWRAAPLSGSSPLTLT